MREKLNLRAKVKAEAHLQEFAFFSDRSRMFQEGGGGGGENMLYNGTEL